MIYLFFVTKINDRIKYQLEEILCLKAVLLVQNGLQFYNSQLL